MAWWPEAVVAACVLLVVGALGSLALASVRRAAAPRPGRAYVRTAIPGPEAARAHAARPTARRPSLPLGARVVAARRRDDPGAIALLRRALADRDEEVRLVAHAVLESKHRALSARLTADARDGATDPGLAAAHWELARTGLVDGECLAHALASARQCVRAAAAHPHSASLALLEARIELHRGAPAEAEAALARAIALGLPPAIAAPYLAEAAFLGRRFDRVAQQLAAAPADSAALARIRRYWT